MKEISYQQYEEKLFSKKIFKDNNILKENIRNCDLIESYQFYISNYNTIKIPDSFCNFLKDIILCGLRHWEKRLQIWKNNKKLQSKKNYINRYGWQKGNEKYKEYCNKVSYGGTIQYYIDKYGKEEGSKRYNDILLSKSMSLDGFIRRYGEEEGNIKYKHFCERNKGNLTLDRKIEIHGDIAGKMLYEKQKYNFSYTKTKKYFIDKYGNDEIFYRRINAMRETQTKEAYIKKYGENSSKMKDHTSKESFILKYGEEEGLKRFKKYSDSVKYTSSYQYYVDKYGEKNAPIMWAKKYKNFLYVSDLSVQCFNDIIKDININDSIYFGKNNEFGKYDTINKKYYFYDFVIPSIKYCIEFNGDLYHANPSIYNSTDVPKFPGNTLSAKDIWEHDNIKINLIKSMGFYVDIIWECDYMKKREDVISFYKKKIIDLISKKGDYCYE